MAIKFGSNKDKKKLEALLVQAHRLGIIVELMDLSHNYKGDLSNRLLSGQVNIDNTADVTRNATLELLDADHKLKLDAEAPEDGSLYFTKMIKITYEISTIDRSEEYHVPIFCGPLTKVDRTGPIISVEAQGKESLSFANIWSAKTYKKGAKKTDVIKSIMSRAGEANRKMDIPKVKHHPSLGSPISADLKKTFWKVARKVSKTMNMQLFYDGRGVLRLRRLPSKVAYNFGGKALMSAPQVTYDATDIYNAVKIEGGKPKKAKKKVRYKMVAPRKHPLSPWKLGRTIKKDGQEELIPRYLLLVISDDSIKSKKVAHRVAKKQLKNALHESIEVAFDSLPIPYLEELDLCRFHTDENAGKFRLQKMSIPLTADGTSSIGYLKRVSPRRRSAAKSHKRRNK